MTNEERQNIIDDLEKKGIAIANTVASLAFQGYSINKNKNIKLTLDVILINLFQNIDIFTEEQQNNINVLYNKFQML